VFLSVKIILLVNVIYPSSTGFCLSSCQVRSGHADIVPLLDVISGTQLSYIDIYLSRTIEQPVSLRTFMKVGCECCNILYAIYIYIMGPEANMSLSVLA
jgi:hypothetical protein